MSRKFFLILSLLLFAATAFSQVMINEFLYDTVGDDDPNLVFTEIYGPPGTSLDGWTLVGINGNGGTAYRTIDLEGDIPGDGYFVVGNTASVTNVDLVVGGGLGAGVDWQNAGSASGEDCDGLELHNASDAVVDHVCYGNCAAGHICDGEGGNNAPDPFASGGVNRSLARIPDHSDTDDNGVDWSSSDTPTPGLPNSGVPCEPVETDLSAVRTNNASGVPTLIGQFVIVQGIVNVDNYTLDSLTESNFFIQNDDAGVNVFRGTVPADLVEGALVTVSGWVDQYNGLTEIVSSGSGNCNFQVEINGNETPPTPAVLQCNSFFEAFEGMLARINNVTIVDGVWPGEGEFGNITISDGTGTLLLRIDTDTEVDGSPAPDGAFDIIGIITQFDDSSPYDEEYQLTPRYPSDVLDGASADDSPVASPIEFTLDGAFPNPFNSAASIRYTVGSARDLTLSIYDLLGREVESHPLNSLTPGLHTFNWAPSGATGVYLVRLSGTNSVQSSKILYLK